MRIRLIVILILLVLLPTGILALVASHALQSWEHELHAGLARAANNSIGILDARLRSDLESDLAKVRDVLSDCLSRGSKLEFGKRGTAEAKLLHDSALQLAQAIPIVDQVYLFMNPWGFIYPFDNGQPGGTGSHRPDETELPALIQSLRSRIALAPSLTGAILFSREDRTYCFSLLRDRKGLYSGYKVSNHGLNKLIQENINAISGKGFILSVSGMIDPDSEGIVVSDSFSGGQLAPRGAEGGTKDLLAVNKLAPPFEYIEVRAYVEDPEALLQGGAFRARLFRWGIALLAITIMAGVGVVMLEASQQVRKAREKSHFIMGVSHDLRTPISSIKMLAESLHMGNIKDENKKQHFLGTIVNECNHLADMIERVLFFMKQEQGAAVYSFAAVAPGALVHSAVDAFNERVQGRAEVQLDIGENLPEVDVDENALLKVMQNILDNAMKYSGEGIVRIDVAVGKIVRHGREWISIAVRDYGRGIDAKERSRVFRRFYRADIEKDGNVGGVGLGLAICRDIIRAHKGRIEVESEVGKGSKFMIYLPANKDFAQSRRERGGECHR